MLCPNCKKEIPDGVQFCSNCGANFAAQPQQPISAPVQQPVKQKKPITKKWWFWVIIALVVIVLIGAIGGGSEDDTSAPAVTTTQSADSDKTETNTTVVTTTAPEITTVSDGAYKIGDTVNDGGVKITFVSAEEWYDYNEYYGPADGKKIIRVKIDVANGSNVDSFITSYSFDCYVDNQPAEHYIWADDEYSGSTLSAGRSNSGYLYFEVPADAESAEIEYETNYWTDKKAIIEIDF